MFDIPFADRFLIAGRALWFYAAKLLWPANLSFIYPRWNVDAGTWWQWVFPAGGLLAAVLALVARRNRGPLAALLLFARMLFPNVSVPARNAATLFSVIDTGAGTLVIPLSSVASQERSLPVNHHRI